MIKQIVDDDVVAVVAVVVGKVGDKANPGCTLLLLLFLLLLERWAMKQIMGARCCCGCCYNV